MMEDAEDENGLLLGDVVVCPEIASENAAKLGHGLAEEIDTLLVHGTLHLLGYDHQGPEDKERMNRRIRQVLESYSAAALS
jgi:probable rRNA maturation factor